MRVTIRVAEGEQAPNNYSQYLQGRDSFCSVGLSILVAALVYFGGQPGESIRCKATASRLKTRQPSGWTH